MSRPAILAAALAAAAAAVCAARRHRRPDSRHEDHLRKIFRARARAAVPDDYLPGDRTVMRLARAIAAEVCPGDTAEGMSVPVRDGEGNLTLWTMAPWDACPAAIVGCEVSLGDGRTGLTFHALRVPGDASGLGGSR